MLRLLSTGDWLWVPRASKRFVEGVSPWSSLHKAYCLICSTGHGSCKFSKLAKCFHNGQIDSQHIDKIDTIWTDSLDRSVGGRCMRIFMQSFAVWSGKFQKWPVCIRNYYYYSEFAVFKFSSRSTWLGQVPGAGRILIPRCTVGRVPVPVRRDTFKIHLASHLNQ